MEWNYTDLIGHTFNRLTVVKQLSSGRNKRVLAVCDCGVEKEYYYSAIKHGKTKSCGCQRVDSNKTGHNTKHNLGSHPLYSVWCGMRDRCRCVTDAAYPNYGGRGVLICKEWDDFKCFYDWAMANGYKKGLHLDKDKLSPFKTGIMYSPEFCCFLTFKENMRYRRNAKMLTFNNETKSLLDWADLYGLDYKLITNRLKMGWSIERALTSPISKKWSRHKSAKNTLA